MKKRLLGAQEILFYAMNEASPKHFLMVAETEGYTTQAAWQAAVASLQKAHPMLRTSIVQQDENLLFFEEEDAAPLQLDIVALTPAFDQITAIEAALEAGFQSDKGPLARIKLFHSEEKCIVIIATHHSVADALSSVSLLNDLLGFLAGKSIAEFPLQPSVDELLGYTNDGMGTKITKQLTPGVPLPHTFLQVHPPARVDVLYFSAELTERLAYCAKAQGTTLHGALQAAAALALRVLAFEVERPAYIMSPFSVRSEFHIGTDCGLFIDTKIVAVPTDAALDFWDIARAAKDGLADVHSPEFLKQSAEQLRGLIRYSDDLIQFIKDNFNFDVMLSNLGRLSFTNATAQLKVNKVAGPFIISGFNNQQAIGAATFEGKLVLTNSSRYLVPGLLSIIKTKIEAACAGIN